jgi:hypothetical protein
MPTIINGSSPSITFSDNTTQATAGLTAASPTISSGSLTFVDGTSQASGNITVGSLLEYNANTSLPQSAFGRLVTSNTVSATTLTLPTIAGNSGKVITISNLGSGIVTINAGENTSGIFVNGFTYTGSPASFIMGQGQSVQLATDGGNWKAVQASSWGIGGGNQSWQNVTGARALGTSYTNTTGRSICVILSLSQNTAGFGHQVNVGSISYNAGQNNNTGGITTSSYTIVPNGVSYNISAQTGQSIGYWAELR